MTKNLKKIIAGKLFILFWSKIAIYFFLGIHKGCTSLHPLKEKIQHFETWKFFTFFFFFFSFMSNFCPLRSGSSNSKNQKILIRINNPERDSPFNIFGHLCSSPLFFHCLCSAGAYTGTTVLNCRGYKNWRELLKTILSHWQLNCLIDKHRQSKSSLLLVHIIVILDSEMFRKSSFVSVFSRTCCTRFAALTRT